MAVVNEVSDILEASSRLQTPYLPLVLVVYQGLSFTDSSWPEEGLRITANVTLSATLGSYVTISFGLKTVLFTVDKNFSSTAFLSFRGCILVDLPLSYLPVHHPRRPFGVLSTALWPVYREEVAMGLYSCTLILTHEEFKFWSFWLSILVSPIPSVRAMGNWTYASKVTLGTSGDDFIQLENYFGRYTTLHDVRYQVSNELYATQQRNNILQITNDEAVPPTVVFQTRNSSDLLSALSSSPSATAAQHGQYIILTANLTIMNESQWPPDGAPIRYPTTITTWPSSWVAFDLRQMRNAFKILGSTSTTIKNVVLLNLAPGPSDSELAGLTTGLWAFNFSWGNADYQRLNLDNVVMVVPREEVNYYITTAVDQKQTDTWISSFEVLSQDTVNRSWVQFRSLATTRFIARYLNITDTIPYVFDSDSLNITTVSGHVWNFRDGGSASEDGRNVLLFALVAIALPTALGSALLTYILLRRRRLTRLCQSEGPPQGSKLKDGGGDGEDCAGVEEHEEHKAARQDELPACCFPFPLSLPLRKSKFVNPLYHDGGRAPPDIILTGVLGPAALARSLAPVPPETTILDSSTSISTVAELALELEGVPAAQGETLAEQTVTGDAFTGRRSGNSPGDNPPLCVLSAAPAELRQGREASESLADAAADSGISSLSETCTAGFGPRLEHGGPSRSSATRLTPGGVNTVMQSAAAGCATGGTALLVHGAGTRPPPPEISCERRDSPAVAAATAELAIMPSTSRGQNADAGISEIVRAGAHCLAPNAHPGGCGEAGLQLDRLRREIGDRHLEVQHSLGWGGCGVVYKGVWKGLQVAVKTILLQGDSKQSHQFLTEAEISASLQHANIVTTYLYELRPLGEVDSSAGAVEIRTRSASSDEAPGQDTERMSCWKLYIVQEYCELGTLKAAIDQGYFKGSGNGLPNLAFLLTMALDISLGLAHVHSKNVVHGDVTVSNVLLQAFPGRPQGCIAKVADFGLSVKFEAGQSQGYHLYGGTPHYMAPERVRGFLYKQSDIYSLDLGHRFPNLARLDLSGDSQLVGGLTLFRALQSASQLTSISFATCTSLPASFVTRQLIEACPRLQHLALSCCCSGGADTEAATMSALAAAPLAATLTSLDLHCGNAFQPELRHLEGLGSGLMSLRIYGSRTLSDEALAVLPHHMPALAEVVLAEQHSRRGRHVRGEGLAALRGLTALRALSLACPEPDARSMATALATLTQLTELDISRCEPQLLEALSPLSILVCNSGDGGGMLQRLSLPTAYTERQLERGLPVVFGSGAAIASGGDEDGAAMMAVQLQALHLHASAALPVAMVEAMSRLGNLRQLSLSHCGPAGSGATVQAAAAALTKLTSFRLVQEYGSSGDGESSTAAGGVAGPAGGRGALHDVDPHVGGNTTLQLHGQPDVVTWYDGLLTWSALMRLELTDLDGLDDAHLFSIGCSLSVLSCCRFSRNTRITGVGFASWPAGCRRLKALTLYDCARVGDAALEHVSAMPLLTLTLAYLPEVGADGVRHLAEGCKSLRSLILERMARAPGAALAALWRLPRLEALCLRMCNVNNLTLEMALPPPRHLAEDSPAAAGAVGAVGADLTAVGGESVSSTAMTGASSAPAASGREDAAGHGTQLGQQLQSVWAAAQHLTWLELQGSLAASRM
ncbi:hypothetical protein VOLCADRAFT_98524 [Volvox carteri f. nagariensis]|uniref:Protein kinase domain-containing protein n=1 Tax=Volvox carteri f. nagariensis TaxID=3068 RepID=D8UFK3_VOLCA|nr:uncharacterized protein VOLCADRAFT_98524 [Volvox carteri f. nagariensis]EFJ41519.1 hypothetical protein VOLCADRAFT_98524 [Volvox carteri f. nagariensis]|eukprot:XP_002957464.1 hypothetical protein VOLCADRAFT_98524 [Volvox carteri f. nagariensis]